MTEQRSLSHLVDEKTESPRNFGSVDVESKEDRVEVRFVEFFVAGCDDFKDVGCLEAIRLTVDRAVRLNEIRAAKFADSVLSKLVRNVVGGRVEVSEELVVVARHGVVGWQFRHAGGLGIEVETVFSSEKFSAEIGVDEKRGGVSAIVRIVSRSSVKESEIGLKFCDGRGEFGIGEIGCARIVEDLVDDAGKVDKPVIPQEI